MVDLNANAQQSQELSRTRTWYLDDRPLENFERVDHFRHRAYVSVLLQAIRELSPPSTVGIFGSWGIGKTSIANDLQYSIKSHKEFKGVPIVLIDVWKYGGDSLRRQFLWDAQEALKKQETLKKKKVLSKRYDIIKKLYKERIAEIESEPRFSWRRLQKLAPFLLISCAVTFIALWIFLQLGVATPLQALAVSLMAPILLLLIPEFLRKVVVKQKGAEIEPRLFSAEQFEQAFEDMISKAKCDKMIILIDNLDRCSNERVVETLSVVKTYLEPKGKKCIFVIPCDDAAIKQHIKIAYHILAESGDKTGSAEYADEYLRKFFNTSIRISPFIQTEVEPYIADLLGRIRLTEKMSEEDVTRIVQLIGAAFTENPRRIKQFLNNLTVKYLLVKEREDAPYPLINPPISSNLLFLAKVSVIEAKFLEEFADFVGDDHLYGEVNLALEPGKVGSDKANTILEKTPKLRQFLFATRDITDPNPKAFFHLKQSRQEIDIPNYDEFLNAVLAGGREAVQSLIDKGNDTTNRAQCEEIRSQIKTNVERGYYNYAISAIDVAGAIFDEISDEYKIMLAQDVIGVIAMEEGVRRMLALLKPEEIFFLIPKALRDDRRLVLNEYITLYSREPEEAPIEGVDTYALQLSIAEAMVGNLGLFSKPQRRRVKEATLGLKSPSPSLLLAISSTDDAKSEFVAPALIIKSLEELKTEEVASFAQAPESEEEHFPSIEFVLRCQDIAGDDVGGLWTKKCAELLELAAKENNPSLQEYTNRCIGDSEILWSKGPEESVDQLAHLLRDQYPQASQDRRLEIVLTLSAMQEHCSESEKTEIKNLLLGQFIQSEPPTNVSRFLATHADRNYEGLPYHQQAFDHLAQRVVSEGNSDVRHEIINGSISINGLSRTDLFINLLMSLMKQPQLQVVISLVREVHSEFPKGPRGKNLVAPLLSQILKRSREQAAASDIKTLLELSIYLKKWHTRQFQKEFESFVAELLTSTDPTMREVGLGAMKSAESEGVITEDRRRQILRRVFDWLTQERPQPDGSIMEELTLVVGAKESLLSIDLQSSLLEYLRTLTTPQTPPDYRRRAFGHLSSFIGVQRDLLEGLIPELIGYAESEGDANIRNEIEESLLSLRTGNMPLDRDLWDDFYRYIRALMVNPDPERQKRGRQLFQRMRQITRDVKKKTGL